MQIRLPKKIGKYFWMRKLKLGFKVLLKLRPNHPNDIYYILTR